MMALFLIYHLKIRRFFELIVLMLCIMNHTTEKRNNFYRIFPLGGITLFTLYILTKVYSDIVPEATWGTIAEVLNRDSILMMGMDVLMLFLFYSAYQDKLANVMGKFVIGYSAYFILNSIYTLTIENNLMVNGLTLGYVAARYSMYFAMLALLYFLCLRKWNRESDFILGGKLQSGILYTLFFLTINLLHVFSLKIYFTTQIRLNYIAIMVHMVVCLNYLIILDILERHNKIKQDYMVISSLIRTQKAQYDLSKETVEIINRKCHDLKYQIAALNTVSENRRNEAIKELTDSVNIYDGISRTNNPVLDTVLSEKGLICQEQGIRLSCIVDAGAIEFMDPVDIYILIGNAIGNAMEYLAKIDDVEKRIISFSVRHVGNMCLIRVDNYFRETDRLIIENGLPLTTKSNKKDHGFGLKSIRFTAEKYKGQVNVTAEDGLFSLQIGIPIAT